MDESLMTNTYILNAYGKSGKQWALTIECESIEEAEEAANDLGLMLRWSDIGELIQAVPDRRSEG